MYNPGNEISSINFGAIIGGALNAVVRAQSDSANTTVNFIKSVGFKPGEIDTQTGEEKGVGEPIYVTFSYDKEVSPAQTQREKKFSVTVPESDTNNGFSNPKNIALSIDGNTISDAKIKVEDGKITEVMLGSIPSGDFMKNDAEIIAVETKDGAKSVQTSLKLVVKETQIAIPPLFQKMEISVPILTMMPIPFIKIEHATIDFNVKINSVSNTAQESQSNTNITSNTKAGYNGLRVKAETSLNASFSNQKKSSSTEEVKKDYSLNISIRAVQDDMPLGVSRLLDILEDSITTKSLSEPATKAIE